MRRLLGLVLIGLLTALSGWWAIATTWGDQHHIAPPEAIHTPAPEVPEDLKLVGAGSCTAVACHGGPLSADPARRWNSSYRIWMKRDPHAGAGEVLRGDLAARMVKALRSKCEDGRDAKAWEVASCLGCHSPVTAAMDSQFATVADGVDCESCHGAAEKWLGPHVTRDWEQYGAAERKRLGFVETKDLGVRTQLCAECHVGSPGREVTHDLIAAGHPRLTFEFSAYTANMPRHWNEPTQPDALAALKAKEWAVGQVATAQAALRLLQCRSAAVAALNAPAWPEFAEFDCFQCHHDLKAESYRRAGQVSRRLDDQRPQKGLFTWGSWYFPMARHVAEVEGGDPQAIEVLNAVEAEMSRVLPDSAGVAKQAEKASQALGSIAQSLQNQNFDAFHVDQMLADLGRPDAANFKNWDEAAQWYLACVALTEARLKSLPKPSLRRNELEQLKTALEEIRKRLEFPTDVEKATGKKRQYDSPRNFNPSSQQLQDDVKRVRQRLRQRAGDQP